MITLKNAFKNRNKIMKEISSGHISTADEGESDTHYLPPGEERVLGMDMSKPEPWYERGGYQQLDFPTADAMVDEDDDSQSQVKATKTVTKTGVKYTGFKNDVAGWDKWGHKDFSTDFTFDELMAHYGEDFVESPGKGSVDK
tara:strand:- start:80 stop:505 length:426 start_codon:yes stop_codon:yes gene_type:complete